LQPLLCATLCAFGSTLGWLVAWDEAYLQMLRPLRAGGFVLLCAATGSMLGLWLPRRAVLRRLTQPTGNLTQRAASLWPDEPAEFAASFAGLSILSLGAVWALAAFVGLHYEEMRQTLVGGFYWPMRLLVVALVLPGLLLMVLAGAAGTVVLLVLHGWYRLVAPAPASLHRLWLFLCAGTLAGGLLAAGGPNRTLLVLAAPLAAFLGGALTVPLRRPRRGAALPQHVAAQPAAPVFALREEALTLLLVAAIGTSLAGVVLLRVAADGSPDVSLLGAWVAALGAGVLLPIVGMRLPWFVQRRNGAPLALLVCAAAVLWHVAGPAPHRAAALLQATLLGGAACGGVIMAARRIAQTCGSLQPALSWVGVALAAGVTTTGLLLPAVADYLDATTIGLLIALALAVVAGLVLILDDRPGWLVRGAGLAALTCGLFAVPVLGANESGRRAPPTDAASATHGWARLVRSVLRASGPRSIRLVAATTPQDALTRLGTLDLHAARGDWLVLLYDGASTGGAPRIPAWRAWREAAAARVARRLLHQAERGARLLVEPPLDAWVAAAAQEVGGLRDGTAPALHHVRAERDGRAYDALLIARDAPFWFRHHAWPPNTWLSVVPLNGQSPTPR